MFVMKCQIPDEILSTKAERVHLKLILISKLRNGHDVSVSTYGQISLQFFFIKTSMAIRMMTFEDKSQSFNHITY